ncbi:MAG: hypothetical protein ACR2NY_04750 [Alphaproteobacteria bacterium]
MKNIFFGLLKLAMMLVAMMLVLSACGLHPAYQFDKKTGAMKNNILQDITIDRIAKREGQILKNELEYAFGPRKKFGGASKGLRAQIYLVNSILGDASVSNVNQVEEVVVNVNFVLYEKSSGKVLDEFTISQNSSNVVVSLSGFSQAEVRKKKLEFAMKNIALDARNRLLLYKP